MREQEREGEQRKTQATLVVLIPQMGHRLLSIFIRKDCIDERLIGLRQ